MSSLILAAILYLGLLFVIAEATERRLIPESWATHPLVHALSLGVYATSWSYFGSVGFARRDGLSFLTIYLGVTLSCLATPFVWRPVNRIMRERQLGSLADLFAYRYQSQLVGALVTLLVLGGSLPYIALQIRAIVGAIAALSGASSPWLPPGYAALVAAFAAVFGARHASVRARHPGLVLAMAVESFVKLIALLAVAATALFGVFGGWGGLTEHLAQHPDLVSSMLAPARASSWYALMLITFAAAFLLPRQFHLAFNEGADERALDTISWLLPVYLLLLTLPVPLILWAGQVVAPGGDADLYVLRVVQGHRGLEILVFLGGLSASSAMAIVTGLAVAPMIQTHLFLPLVRPQWRDLHVGLARLRRVFVVIVIAAGVGVMAVLPPPGVLADLGLAAFVATAQFLPPLVGVLFWRRASAAGAALGLIAGSIVWLELLLGPPRPDPWGSATSLSLTLNGALFLIGSWVWPPSREAEAAAETCAGGSGDSSSEDLPVAVLVERLTPVLGERAAVEEVERVVSAFPEDTPLARRARAARLETNLSALVGPVFARLALGDVVPRGEKGREALLDQVRFFEAQGARAAADLRGPAAAADAVRRWLRQVLEAIPLGVAVVAPDGEVVLWNPAMAQISGVAAEAAVGQPVSTLGGELGEALAATRGSGAPVERTVEGRRSLVLWSSPLAEGSRGWVLLAEDRSARRALEAQLAHQDRLASVGRLAAGVAHEIGNPLTGVLMLARRLAREAEVAEVREDAETIALQADRIHRIVQSLVGFSRKETEADATAELGKVVDDAVRLAGLARAERAIAWSVRGPRPVQVRGDAARLTQVVVNLLANAADASPRGASVEIAIEVGESEIALAVIDHGTGVPAELRPRIFEPFFTTKEPGQGTGLGLSIVFGLVEALGGRLHVEDTPGGGATFQVVLKSVA